MNDENIFCSCGICLENINTKCINYSIELECKHWFHSKCVKLWSTKCIDNNTQPTCPFCRQIISNEYLDILGIHFYSSNIDIITNIVLISNTIELFNYIVKNKIYEDENKLLEYIERYPNEIENIILILENIF